MVRLRLSPPEEMSYRGRGVGGQTAVCRLDDLATHVLWMSLRRKPREVKIILLDQPKKVLNGRGHGCSREPWCQRSLVSVTCWRKQNLMWRSWCRAPPITDDGTCELWLAKWLWLQWMSSCAARSVSPGRNGSTEGCTCEPTEQRLFTENGTEGASVTFCWCMY